MELRAQGRREARIETRQIWAIRFFLDQHGRIRDRALFDLAIDSKLRRCDLVKIKIGDIVCDRKIRQRGLAMLLFEQFGALQPLNRHRDRYAREGVALSLSTLADQVGASTAALMPLYLLIEAHVLAAKTKADTGRIWTYIRDVVEGLRQCRGSERGRRVLASKVLTSPGPPMISSCLCFFFGIQCRAPQRRQRSCR